MSLARLATENGQNIIANAIREVGAEALDGIGVAEAAAKVAEAKAQEAKESATSASASATTADSVATALTTIYNDAIDQGIVVAPAVDATLSVRGAAADAQVTGERKTGNGSNIVNLLRSAYRTDGKYRSYNGNLSDAAGYSVFDYVPIKPNTTYFIGFGSNTHIAFADIDKTHISGKVTNINTEPVNGCYITSPATAAYVSYSCLTTNIGTNYAKLYLASGALNDDSKNIFAADKENLPVFLFEDIYNVPLGTTKKSNKNLFNKNAVRENYYVAHNGTVSGLTGYGYFSIEVTPGTKYTVVNFSNAHNAFFQSDGTFISGSVINSTTTVTAPANAAFWGISCKLSDIDKGLVVAEGETASYSEFGSGALYGSQFITVGEGRDYSTITEATNASSDGDIILIYPGTYHEHLHLRDKNITLMGLNKEECILEYENGNYYYPPLEFAKGAIYNLTIKCISQEQQEGAPALAYCMHCDYNQMENHSIYCENVKFINPDKTTIGVGLRANHTLELVNCEFQGGNVSVYVHDDPHGTAINQNVIFRDCTIVANEAGNNAILLQSQEFEGSVATATFQRCIVRNRATPNALIAMIIYEDHGLDKNHFLGSTDWYLSDLSALNTLDTINA